MDRGKREGKGEERKKSNLLQWSKERVGRSGRRERMVNGRFHSSSTMLCPTVRCSCKWSTTIGALERFRGKQRKGLWLIIAYRGTQATEATFLLFKKKNRFPTSRWSLERRKATR